MHPLETLILVFLPDLLVLEFLEGLVLQVALVHLACLHHHLYQVLLSFQVCQVHQQVPEIQADLVIL